MFGLGNYDANVLINAVQKRGFRVDWYDRRRRITPESVNIGNDDAIIGLICNRPTRSMMGLMKGAHWYSIRLLGDKYYNLDSYLPRPQAFADEASVRLHLQALLDSSEEANLLMIRKPPENPYTKENYTAAAAQSTDDSEAQANTATESQTQQSPSDNNGVAEEENGDSAEKLASFTQEIDE